METKQENKKVFLEIVKQLKELIEVEGIGPGDKLPSERVLSERLNVGRSSVREALRSLELLGLIETRHGGGTFLSSGQHIQLVEILASFILKNTRSLEEVHATRRMHEKEAIRVICSDKQLTSLPVWESLFFKIEVESDVVRDHILREIMIASGNRLALKIWMQLAAYSAMHFKRMTTKEEKPILLVLLKSLQLGYTKEALNAYDSWMNYLRNIDENEN
ncbi:GntR family transcriptional regulator [Ureibacillus massiliensis 4400831 = CIP 108448 = CCUG 49529]|uniref:GntR family transcriptional regulator n=1 Tax=Ureibacillus massiliensis 4400831 = CIP 108448 = CCUG 49529 TaxID=1211035 RepID=A0A0A3J6T7_9BACL|nr:GntR family transcriptional regulator [Ureibacillus massiliensis]KGR91445.1 GntR family transcriptional regulator [Ureibacillus massiliensis 4400831 = CIP 108448 = CCUG 49529]